MVTVAYLCLVMVLLAWLIVMYIRYLKATKRAAVNEIIVEASPRLAALSVLSDTEQRLHCEIFDKAIEVCEAKLKTGEVTIEFDGYKSIFTFIEDITVSIHHREREIKLRVKDVLIRVPDPVQAERLLLLAAALEQWKKEFDLKRSEELLNYILECINEANDKL